MSHDVIHNTPPRRRSLYSFTPIFVWNERNFSLPSDFVITSAIWCSVGTCSLLIFPVALWLQIYRNLVSMCFVWSLICPDLISSSAPWLSINTRAGSDCVILKESSKARCQRTSFTTVDAAINSASTVDSDTLDCFFDPQEIAPPSNNNVYPNIDFLSILSPVQSESTYAICYDSELLTRSNCDRNPRQPCILSSPPVRGSG